MASRVLLPAAVRMIGIALLCAACSSSPCAPDQVVDCPDCGPGELRRAYTFQSEDEVPSVGFANGTIVCLQCADVWSLAGDGTTAQQSIDVGSRTELDTIAGASDGTIYLVADDAPPPPPADNDDWSYVPPPPTNVTVFAIDPSDHVSWSVPLVGQGAGLVAGTSGPFLLTSDDLGVTHVVALAASTGAMQWQADLSEATVAPDLAGGLYVATNGFVSGPGATAAQIGELDSSGAPTGPGHSISTSSTAYSIPTAVFIHGMAATADGGLFVVGEVSGDAIDFGDLTIQPTGAGGADISCFVAAFDRNGATMWAYAFDAENLQQLSIAASGDVALIGGEYVGDPGNLGLPTSQYFDVVVAAFDAGGLRAAHAIGGSGAQTSLGIAAASPESAWIFVLNDVGMDGPPTDLDVGSQTFSNGESSKEYLFELAL